MKEESNHRPALKGIPSDSCFREFALEYYGSDSMPPRKTAAECEAMFGKVADNLQRQYGNPERVQKMLDSGIPRTLLQWHFPIGFAYAMKDAAEDQCYYIGATIYDGSEDEFNTFIARVDQRATR